MVCSDFCAIVLSLLFDNPPPWFVQLDDDSFCSPSLSLFRSLFSFCSFKLSNAVTQYTKTVVFTLKSNVNKTMHLIRRAHWHFAWIFLLSDLFIQVDSFVFAKIYIFEKFPEQFICNLYVWCVSMTVAFSCIICRFDRPCNLLSHFHLNLSSSSLAFTHVISNILIKARAHTQNTHHTIHCQQAKNSQSFKFNLSKIISRKLKTIQYAHHINHTSWDNVSLKFAKMARSELPASTGDI